MSDDATDQTHYVPSGRVSWRAVPATVLACLVAAASGWVYAYANVHLPYILSAAALVTFCVWLGFLGGRVCRLGRVRNPRWMARAGKVIAVAGWYSQWAAWTALMDSAISYGHPISWVLDLYAHLVAHPWNVATGALDLARLAEAALDDNRIAGLWLLPLWALELLLMVGITSFMAELSADQPFCEKSTTWADKVELAYKFAFVTDAVPLYELLEVNPAHVAAALHPCGQADPPDYAQVIIHRCAASDSYLTIENCQTVIKDGEKKRKLSNVLDKMRLRGVDVEALIQSLHRRASHPVQGPSDANRPPPAELAYAVRRLEASDHATALRLAVPHVDSDRFDLRCDARRLSALAAGGLGRWPEAYGYWLTLFVDEPGAHNALQVATSAVMAGKLEEGEDWFGTAEELNEASPELPDAVMLTSFLTALSQRGEHAEGLPYVEELRDMYAGLKTTDPTAHHMAGMPFFADFLCKSLPFVQATLPAQEWRGWYEEIHDKLDDAGQRQLKAWLDEQLAPVA